MTCHSTTVIYKTRVRSLIFRLATLAYHRRILFTDFFSQSRFLRSLKSDTLLIIDNFNVTATQDSFLSVVLKYRCQILFTTRSKLDEYCTLPLKEIEDMNALFQLASAFYSEADTYRATVEKIIETVHSHTFAVELAAKLLENGISTPDQLLTRLQYQGIPFR